MATIATVDDWDTKDDLISTIRDSIHSLFNSPHDIVRHWTLIQMIATQSGIERWWQGELLGHLQRHLYIPRFDLYIFKEKNQRTDLLISYPKKKRGKVPEWNDIENDPRGKIFIPIELKVITENDKTINVKRPFVNEEIFSGLLRDAQQLYSSRKKYPRLKPYGILALMVTGMYRNEVYKEILTMAQELDFGIIPKENIRSILDEKIYIKKDFTELGEKTDKYVENAKAHQFVWTITPKK